MDLVRWRRIVVLVVLAMLATACAKTPPGGAVAYGIPYPAQEVGIGGAAGGLGGASGPATPSALGPGSATPGAASGGSSGAAQSTLAKALGINTTAAPIASYPGVTPTEIDIAFAAKLHDCSENGDSTQASAGTWVQKYADEVHAFVDYINQYIPLPGHRHLKLVGNDTSFGIPLVDDGGLYCPNKQAAAGRYIAASLKPFAALTDDYGDFQFPLPIVQGRILTIAPFLSMAQMHSAYPYAWDFFGTAEDWVQTTADFANKRMQNTPYASTSGSQAARVYGLIADNDPSFDPVVSAVQSDFGHFGMNVSHVYRVPNDNTQISENGQQVALQMEQDGVNTLIWEMPGGYPQVDMMKAMGNIGYYPDQLMPGSVSAFWGAVFPQDEMQHVKATGPPAIIADRDDLQHYNSQPENGDAYDAVWAASKEADGKTANNGSDGFGIWDALMTLALGFEMAPVNFTPSDWAKSIERTSDPAWRCPVEQFWGRDHPQNGQLHWSQQDPSGFPGYTTLYWVAKQSSLGSVGYWESYDGYNRYSGYNDLPGQATDDTGNQAVPPMQNVPYIGLSPFKSCKSINLNGDIYQ